MSSPNAIAQTPEPPYYAVIFTSIHTGADPEAYARTAALLDELSRTQPGYLGIESVQGASGASITVSYWASEEAIRGWKQVADHRIAQQAGRERWYADYTLRVARVERAYTLARSPRVGLTG